MNMSLACPALFGSIADLTTARSVFGEIGFAAVRNAGTISAAQSLEREANELICFVKRAKRDDDQLRYSAGIAGLGPLAQAFLTGAELAECLHVLTGAQFALTRDMSCLTVYETGDQLGAHLDQPPGQCAVTCILYLSCTSPDPQAPDTGLQLKVFGRDQNSILYPPRSIIPTLPGRLVFGRGASVWHERPKLKTDERVMALTACFGPA